MPRKCMLGFLLMLGSAPAVACQTIVQTSLTFADGSAVLDPHQVDKLARWLDEARAAYPSYAEISVDAGASMEATGASCTDVRALANSRAKNTAKALKTLLPVNLPLTISSHAYREKRPSLASSNDFASVQLYPDLTDRPLPDCNPIPIPGFRPAPHPHSPDPNGGASQSPR